MLKQYNPSGKNVHTIRVTFMKQGYTGHIAFEVYGNCCGADLLNVDFLESDTQQDIEQYTENDCSFSFDEGSECFSATLKDKNGRTCDIEGDEETIRSMIVSIEIADVRPE